MNIGMTCDVCGRTVQGCTFVNGMKFCAKCHQETFGQPVNQCLYCSFKNVNNDLVKKTENLKQEIRKQVCDEIRRKMTVYKYAEVKTKNGYEWALTDSNINEILDQIETGE